jgi:hypothetical protein
MMVYANGRLYSAAPPKGDPKPTVLVGTPEQEPLRRRVIRRTYRVAPAKYAKRIERAWRQAFRALACVQPFPAAVLADQAVVHAPRFRGYNIARMFEAPPRRREHRRRWKALRRIERLRHCRNVTPKAWRLYA